MLILVLIINWLVNMLGLSVNLACFKSTDVVLMSLNSS